MSRPGRGRLDEAAAAAGHANHDDAAGDPRSSALKDCRAAGADAIDGLAMTVYRYVPPSFAGEVPQAQKLWIGDADGLPLSDDRRPRAPMEMTVHDGAPLPDS